MLAEDLRYPRALHTLLRVSRGFRTTTTMSTEELVGGVDGAGGDFYRLGEAAADRSQGEGGDSALRLYGEIGGLAREFGAIIEAHAGFLEKLSGETHVFGAVDTPEPKLFFIPLEEVEGLLELFHGAIKGRSQKKDAERPGVAGIVDADADTVFTALILLDAAAIVVTNDGCACRHINSPSPEVAASGVHESLHVGFPPGTREGAVWDGSLAETPPKKTRIG
jgi:hypothetical protein